MFNPKVETFMKKQNGFTLIELLVVVIIIGILVTIAGFSFMYAKRETVNNLQKPRLMDYARAQAKFRDSGRRRYGTMKELCQDALLSDTVAKMSADCNSQTQINGWKITPGDESAAYLREHFFAVINYETRLSGETMPAVCIAEDGVLRAAAATDVSNCTRTSAPYNP